MLTLLLLLSLHPPSHTTLCPCDVTPQTCDTDCCCDISCSAEQVLSFTCQTFLLSDSKLCCEDKLTLTLEGSYQNVRTCSSNLACLQDTPRSYGGFPDGEPPDSTVWRSQLGSSPATVEVGSQTQYQDSDVLLQDNGADPASRFMFPVQFHGDLCAKSPVLFYSEIQSSCRRKVDMGEVCNAGSMLDYHSYLNTLLSFPAANSTEVVDLSDADNIVFYCLDSSKGLKEKCTLNPIGAVPKVANGLCVNAVQEVAIYLTVSADKMTISSAAVRVTLTSYQTNSPDKLSQKFSISYQPSSQVNMISGNFGYVRGSHILSGAVLLETNSDPEVIMNSDSTHRILSLFKSQDCSQFSDHPISFGTGYYTGCKMELPFYNFEVMSGGDKEQYCQVIKGISGSVFNVTKGIVVGATGRASTSDLSQWVYVETEPDISSPAVSLESTVKCSDVISHVTYKVFYTEVGEAGDLQAIITAVKVQFTTQDVVLYCSSTHCTSNKAQYVVLSNSVQFHYNTPDLHHRYKVNPRTTALLPLDFFYPITAGGRRASVGLGWGCVVLGYCFSRLIWAV
ncbi:tectonic-1-like [Bolinopsis microptera]|uniref:tectonic-1-like n=1 Tax=Bolinopsis microptera TaxID=2820187 RepID=UPI00307A3587